jgi:hypothetical protein
VVPAQQSASKTFQAGRLGAGALSPAEFRRLDALAGDGILVGLQALSVLVPGFPYRVEACVGPHPAGREIAATARTIASPISERPDLGRSE